MRRLASAAPLSGFRISVEGGIDLNIPFVTTITLEGSAQLDFTIGTGDTDVRIDLAFDAALSESNVGTIARANGAFHVTIDANLFVDAGGDAGIMLPKVEVWGAAVLDTDFGFLEPIGLFVNAEGLLRINSSQEAKPDEILKDVDGNSLPVALPAESFALRLDGGIDFRIDFNGNGTFAESESVFYVGGIFVLEFSKEGFNVAIFDERANQVVPAGLTLGPKNRPLLEFGVLGFLAIRRKGIAADLVLTASASLPLDLASIDATAVFIVNTTGQEVVFEIPGGATDPNRPTGLSLTIPDAAPANPSGILNHSQAGAGLEYPQLYWTKACKKLPLIGTVCVYYPRTRLATYTFEVGKLKVESPVLGQVDANGLLTLNVGPQASARHLAVSEVNEDVVIADVSAGSQRGRKLGVTMFGLTQTFDNVTRVLIADMGDGNDTVTISEGVVTEVEVHLGDGDDRLENLGSAAVIAYGGGGNDQLRGGRRGRPVVWRAWQ